MHSMRVSASCLRDRPDHRSARSHSDIRHRLVGSRGNQLRETTLLFRQVLLAWPSYYSVSICNDVSRDQFVATVSCQHSGERDHHADSQCAASPTQRGKHVRAPKLACPAYDMVGFWVFGIHKEETVRVCPLHLRYRPAHHDTSVFVEFRRDGMVSRRGARGTHAKTRSEQQRESIRFHP